MDGDPSGTDVVIVVDSESLDELADAEELGDLAKYEEEEVVVEEVGSAASMGPEIEDDELCEDEEAGVEES